MALSSSRAHILLGLLALSALVPTPSLADPFVAVFNKTLTELLAPASLVEGLSKLSLHDVSNAAQAVKAMVRHEEAPNLPEIPFVGPLAPNVALDSASVIPKRVAGTRLPTFKHPLAIAAEGNNLYAGIAGGDIVKYDNIGTWNSIFQVGSPCKDTHNPIRCGKVLDIDFDSQGNMIVADGINGLLKIDLKNKESETLSPKVINKLPLMTINSATVSKSGKIYYTSAGTKYKYNEALMELMDEGSGRVLEYDPNTKSSTVLMCGLSFASGVELSEDETFLMVSEGGRGRVWKHDLTGLESEKDELLVELPGALGKIKQSGEENFIVAIFFSIVPGKSNLLNDVILPSQHMRDFTLGLFYKWKEFLLKLESTCDAVIDWLMESKTIGAPLLTHLDEVVAQSNSLDKLELNLISTLPEIVNSTLQVLLLELLTVESGTAVKISEMLPIVDELLEQSKSRDEYNAKLIEQALGGPGLGTNITLAVASELDNYFVQELGAPYTLTNFYLYYLISRSDNLTQLVQTHNTFVSGLEVDMCQVVTSLLNNTAMISHDHQAHVDLADKLWQVAKVVLKPHLDEFIRISDSAHDLVNAVLGQAIYCVGNPLCFPFSLHHPNHGMLVEVTECGEMVRSWQASPASHAHFVAEGVRHNGSIYVASMDEVYMINE